MTAKAFLAGHIEQVAEEFDVSLVVDDKDIVMLREFGFTIPLLGAPISRRISPWRDLSAVWVLYRHFRREKFHIIHSVTPKAGLLAMLAGWLAQIPVRVHCFTGQVWVTKSGLLRALLKTTDRLVAALSTHILVDSSSQRDFLLSERVTSTEHSSVLADGSICGVDLERFRPNAQYHYIVRQELNIPDATVLLLYLGRLNKDKGILDLAKAFNALAEAMPNLWFLLVGPDEDGMLPCIKALCIEHLHRVRFVGFTDAPDRYMAAADIFCLPSYREGFGTSVIEAASSGVPAVASRIYGLTDAVEDGVTGLLHPPGDVAGLTEKLRYLVENKVLRQEMGLAARERAENKFSQTRLTLAMLAFYRRVAARIVS